MAPQTPPIVATSPGNSYRRRFLTFGTRSLFALTALCGIAAGWWTWPYEVEVDVSVDGMRYCPVGPRANKLDVERPAAAPNVAIVGGFAINLDEPPDLSRREVRTMRRTLSGPVQHGRRRSYDTKGQLRVEDHWRFGVRHGLCMEWDEAGRLEARGNYQAGEPEGKWLSEVDPDEMIELRMRALRNASGRPIPPDPAAQERYYDHFESEYQGGRPVGTWRYFRKGRLLRETTFLDGNVVSAASWMYRGDAPLSVSQTERDPSRTREIYTQWAGDRVRMVEELHHRTIFEPSADGRGDSLQFGRHKSRLAGKERDEKHGPQRAWYENGNMRFEGHWREGVPHGGWRFWDTSGHQTRTVEFEREELVRNDGREFPPASRLQREAYDDGYYGIRIRFGIKELVTAKFDNVPLDELVNWLKESLNDSEVCFREPAMAARGLSPATRFSFECHDFPLGAAMSLALEPLNLVAVHRFGQIWITTTDDPWRQNDRTGISDLRTKPNSKLESALTDPTTLEFIETPLRDVLDYLQDLHAITIGLNDKLAMRIDGGDEIPITCNITGTSLRSALGRLLEKANLACEVRGEKLYICLP